MNTDEINDKLEESEHMLEENERRIEEMTMNLERLRAELAEKQQLVLELRAEAAKEYELMLVKQARLKRLNRQIIAIALRNGIIHLIKGTLLIGTILALELPVVIKLLGELAPMRAIFQGALFMFGLQSLIASLMPKGIASHRWVTR